MIDAAIPMQVIRNDYSSVNVTNSAYTQLSASLSEHISLIEIFDSSGAVLKLAIGASGGEVDMPFYIIPGGNGRMGLLLSKGCRLSIKSVDTATVSTGQIVINLYR